MLRLVRDEDHGFDPGLEPIPFPQRSGAPEREDRVNGTRDLTLGPDDVIQRIDDMSRRVDDLAREFHLKEKFDDDGDDDEPPRAA